MACAHNEPAYPLYRQLPAIILPEAQSQRLRQALGSDLAHDDEGLLHRVLAGGDLEQQLLRCERLHHYLVLADHPVQRD